MSRLVMKFGGTSVADLDRIRGAAAKVRREVERGYEVAVVVSAMAGKTNELVGWVRGTSLLYDAREYDAVVASGENVTAGLMALTLQEMGVPARSWQGWQVPVRTNMSHGAARIEAIETDNLARKFGEGLHAVIAGFQGLGPDGRITTLGRGGSDTTAVALAARMQADRCEIYTDVEGIYTTDPPRPSVVTSPCWCDPSVDPWNPATMTTLPRAISSRTRTGSTFAMRARPCERSVRMPACAPVRLIAGTPVAWSAIATRVPLMCSPVASRRSISRASGSSVMLAARSSR